MDIQEAYDEWSLMYDSAPNATRDLDYIVTRRVLGTLHFGSIIEIGCGTGKNTGLFARRGKRVHAIDFSIGMLIQAKEKLAQRPNVLFSLADITKGWPCAEGSATLVSCNLVLEHIKDLAPVFAEATQALSIGGWLFICELHPVRQYLGKGAIYRRGDQWIQIPTFVHHLSDFLTTAQHYRLTLKTLQEWWHEKDTGKPPRLVSFLFERTA